MAEKKAVERKATSTKTSTKTTKRACVRKAAADKVVASEEEKTVAAVNVQANVDLSAENVGFRAGDVYQVLAAAGKALSTGEIAEAAKITVEETYLGIGWLLKEGKVRNVETLVALA